MMGTHGVVSVVIAMIVTHGRHARQKERHMPLPLTSTHCSMLWRINWNMFLHSLVFVALLVSDSYGHTQDVDESVARKLKSLSTSGIKSLEQQMGQSEWSVVISTTKYDGGVAKERSSRVSRMFSLDDGTYKAVQSKDERGESWAVSNPEYVFQARAYADGVAVLDSLEDRSGKGGLPKGSTRYDAYKSLVLSPGYCGEGLSYQTLFGNPEVVSAELTSARHDDEGNIYARYTVPDEDGDGLQETLDVWLAPSQHFRLLRSVLTATGGKQFATRVEYADTDTEHAIPCLVENVLSDEVNTLQSDSYEISPLSPCSKTKAFFTLREHGLRDPRSLISMQNAFIALNAAAVLCFCAGVLTRYYASFQRKTRLETAETK